MLTKRIGDLSEVKGGYAFSSEDYSNEGVPLIRIGNILDERVVVDNNTIFLPKSFLDKFNEFVVERGDVLIALSGATTGKYGIYDLDEPALLNQRIGMIKFSKTNKATAKFIFYNLPILRHKILNGARGAAQPNISTFDIEEFLIPDFDSIRQQHIVNLLDKADSIRKKRQQQIKLADEFLRSTFLDMFGDPKINPFKYKFEPIGNYTDEVQNDNPLNYPNKLYSYVDISSVDNTKKKVIDVKKYIGLEAPSRARQITKNGDILISTVRPNLNAVAIIENDYENLIVSTGFCVLRCKKDLLDKYYLFTLLTSEYFVSEMIKIAKGASYPAISNNDILNFKIPIPSKDLQQKYSDMFFSVNLVKQKYESTLTESENLFNSLMQKAFRGEL